MCLSLSKERLPAPWDETKDPQKTAQSFMKDSKTLERSKELVAAELEVTKVESCCAHLEPGDPDGARLRKRLETAKLALTKLQKDTPTQGSTVASLEEVLAAHRRATQIRQDRAQKGKEAAMARRAERADLVAKLQNELMEFAQAMEQVEDQLEDEYLQRSIAQEGFEAEVREQIQDLIRQNGGDEPMGSGAPPPKAQVAEPELAEIRARRDEFMKKLAETEAVLAEAMSKNSKLAQDAQEREKAHDQAKAEAEEAKTRLKELEEQKREQQKANAAVAAAAEEDRIELDVDLLPEFTCEEPSPQLIAVFEHAYQVLEQVRWLAGVEVTMTVLPLPWADLLNVVGEQMKTIYPKEPPADAALHPQVLRMLHTALLRISAKLSASSSDGSRSEAEKRAKESLSAQAKRQRRA